VDVETGDDIIFVVGQVDVETTGFSDLLR